MNSELMIEIDDKRPAHVVALRPAWRRVALLSVAALILGVGVASEWRSTPSSDVAWLLWVAERTERGATLYRDIAEVNPPLVVWLLKPVVAVADWTGLHAVAVFRMAVLALGIAVAWWCRRAARPAGAQDWVSILVLLVLVALPIGFFGEREHLLLACLFPYLVMSGARVTPPGSEPPHSLLAGALAGVGVAIKPHYAVVPLLLTAYVSAQTRRAPWRLREVAAGSTVLGAYAVAVALLEPDYLELLRHLGPTYWMWRHAPHLLWLLWQGGSVLTAAALVVYATHRRAVALRRLADILALGAAACLVAAVLQWKGFPYHYYPAIALALCLMGIMARAPLPMAPWLRARTRVLAVAVFLLGTGMFAYMALKRALSGPADTAASLTLQRELAPLPAGGTLAALSPQGGQAFSLVTNGDLSWVLRFPMMWVPVVVYQEALQAGDAIPYHHPAEMQGAERWFYDAVIEDLEHARPDFLLIYRPAAEGENRFDCWQYFGQDERFRRLLAEYLPAPDAGGYRVYRRRAHGST